MSTTALVVQSVRMVRLVRAAQYAVQYAGVLRSTIMRQCFKQATELEASHPDARCNCYVEAHMYGQKFACTID